jgi:hypothetical protein
VEADILRERRERRSKERGNGKKLVLAEKHFVTKNGSFKDRKARAGDVTSPCRSRLDVDLARVPGLKSWNFRLYLRLIIVPGTSIFGGIFASLGREVSVT